MNEVYLTKEQFKALPYKSSDVSKGETYGQIIGLLEKYNVQGYRWTKAPDLDMLEVPLVVDRNGVEYPLKITLSVPRLMYPVSKGRGRNRPKTMTYLENVSWRIFHWYLKSKLEAIACGISDEIKEFMYNVNYALPDGGSISLGQTIMNNVEHLSKLTSLEDKRSVVTIE